MKLLLLFLILVNAVFFAWSRWVDVSPQGVAVATPEPQAEALVLYDEKFPPPTEDDEVEMAVAATVEASDEPAAQSDAATQEVAPPPSEPVAAVTQAEPEPETVEPSEPPPAAPAVSAEARAALASVAQDAEPQLAAVVRDDGPATTRCMTIGPFRELSVAGTIAATLRSSGLEPQARETQAQIWVGHWVHLPPAGSRAAAVEVVEKLRGDGVSDIYIEGSGPMRHAISLGLFSDLSRAETRAGKVRQLGVRPQIRDRYRDGTQHWVDVDLAPGQALNPDLFGTLPDEEASLAERPCETTQEAAG